MPQTSLPQQHGAGSTASTKIVAAIDRREYLLLLLAFLASMTQLLVLPPSIHGDGVGYFAYLRSAFFDHDLQFANEFRHFDQHTTMQMIDRGPTRTGMTYNIWSVGTPLMWSPFYAAGHLATVILTRFGHEVPLDGYSGPYVYSIAVASAVYGFLGLLLTYRLCRRRFDVFPSLLSVVTLWFASSLPAYMYFHPSLSHAASFFLVASFMSLWWGGRESGSVKRWLALGLILGLMTASRPQNALFAVPVGAYESFRLLSGRSGPGRHAAASRVAAWLAAGVGAAIGFAPQVGAWWILYGRLITNPYAEFSPGTGFSWTDPRLWDVLFSSRHGLISWTPVVGLALLGLGVGVVRGDGLLRALAAAFLLQLYLVSAWGNWWQGASFGGRMFIELTPAFALGLCFVVSSARRLVRSLPTALVSGGLIAWNLLLMLQYGTGMLPLEDDVAWSTLIANQVVAAPLKLASMAPWLPLSEVPPVVLFALLWTLAVAAVYLLAVRLPASRRNDLRDASRLPKGATSN